MKQFLFVYAFSVLWGTEPIVEDFSSLDHWKPLTFPNIENHTYYSIEKRDTVSVLKAEARASASGVIFSETFNVYEMPVIRWRWMVSNVFTKGDARFKDGDDYPVRIYIVFQYDPDEAGWAQALKYEAARLVYGEYPPHSSLNYIWANRSHEKGIIPNAYTNQAQMIVLREGPAAVGTWQEEEVDILRDYRAAFGEDPPATASLAIMSDSDNTGESAIAFIDYIAVLPR
ncbi:MAG: DUF3047 domain-containing protein [Fidelibacterota bacterium]